MFETINDIISLSRENGHTFFDKERQREHQTRVLPTLYGGKYFVTEYLHDNRKYYSIYKALKDGACDIVRGEVFVSEKSAKRFLKIVILPNAPEMDDTEEVSYELR